MTPDKETRLKGAYIVNCTGFKKNEETGLVEEIYCTYDPTSKAGTEGANRQGQRHDPLGKLRSFACRRGAQLRLSVDLRESARRNQAI